MQSAASPRSEASTPCGCQSTCSSSASTRRAIRTRRTAASPGDPDGVLEPWTALAFVAARTERIRLGTSICLVPQRNPVYTARQVADVDFLSGGRVDFGIGVGWLREEFEALGVPWKDRGRRTRECISVMKTLWVRRGVEVRRRVLLAARVPPESEAGAAAAPAALLRRRERGGRCDGWRSWARAGSAST